MPFEMFKRVHMYISVFRYSTFKPRKDGYFLDHFDIIAYVRIAMLTTGQGFGSHYGDEIGEIKDNTVDRFRSYA